MKRYNNIFFFTNGSIGDFLMVLYFSSIVFKNDKSIKVNIVTPRNKRIFCELGSRYPIDLYECNMRSVYGIFGYLKLLKSVLNKNAVILPGTSGKIPFQVGFFAQTLAFLKGNLFQFKKFYEHNSLYSESLNKLALGLGFSNVPVNPELEFDKDDLALQKFGLEKNKYIIFHPCGSNKKRTLNKDEIQSVISIIKNKKPGFKIIITGSKKDRDTISSMNISQQSVLNLAGELEIKELVAIVAFCESYIGVDTGITHLASFLNKKSFVIGHEASLFSWMPYYNPNALVVYAINECEHGVHEGREHAKKCYDEDYRYFIKVPLNAIESSLTTFLQKV